MGTGALMEIARGFRAMNTDVQVVIVTDEDEKAKPAAAEVERMFAETEQRLSRFLPESELSELNRSGGRPFRASPLLLQAVRIALDAARDTNGLFDPTVLGALVAAGYDRSFELLDGGNGGTGRGPALWPVHGVDGGSGRGGEGETQNPEPRTQNSEPSQHSRWRDIAVDLEAGTILLPPGTGLDLGGIGKGWTVDRAAAMLASFGSYVVDAGGDIYLAGTQPDGTAWTVGIEDPADPGRDLAVLALRDGAVATSSLSRRRWQHLGREQHHLIDPRTGLPADTGVLSATVVAESVARAETLAKVALLLGPGEGIELIAGHGAEGMLVLAGGRVKASPGLLEGLAHAR